MILFGSVPGQELIQSNINLTQLVDFATNHGLCLRWLKLTSASNWKSVNYKTDNE